MRKFVIFLLIVFHTLNVFCQESNVLPVKKRQTTGSIERSIQPGLDFPDYPQLNLPDKCRDIELPPVVDNSSQPFLRPVFVQQGASCGQSSSVAYNFCYEINRLRNLPSDTSINQYPDHFVWNFMNGTLPYYGEGVSYFHTFDILYDAGNPTEDMYGPITMDDSYYWMDGYEGYFQAMHNRISGVNSIHAGVPEGLIILKHWLHNHLEGSDVGGVANFYAGMPYPSILPAGTMEAGKHVQTSFQEHASHAMTIVGYNDSIRYDVNNDGQYTNHLDITNDGIVDMQDWEIGGLKYVNSYGNEWADSGFCYMLYRTMALKYGVGGLWNNSVHILHPDTTYNPLLTIKATIEHNKRGRLHITAGISSDTSRYYPEHTMSFSIFNFQGLDYYMEGNNLPESKSLEFGLDITPLLNYTKPGLSSRIYMIIEEKDTDNSGEGKLLDYSIISYLENEPREFKSEDSSLELRNNDLTIASVLMENTIAEPLVIHPDDPIIINSVIKSEVQFSANGGYPPYSWQLKHLYHESGDMSGFDFPEGEVQTPTNPENGYSTIPLPFSFPFYGKNYDTLYMHVNGYLMFEKQDMPFYYLLFDEPYLRQIRAIAGYMNKDLALHQISGNFMSVTGSPDKNDFNWKISDAEGINTISFTISLLPDGEVKYHYGPSSIEEGYSPVIGISNGSRQEVQFSENSGKKIKNGQVISYSPAKIPSGISLNDNGILTVEPQTASFADEIVIRVSDSERLTTEQKVLLTTGLELHVRKSDSLAILRPGITVPLSVEIKNHGMQEADIPELSLFSASVNTFVNGGPVHDISVLPGHSVMLNDLFSITLVDTIKSNQLSRIMVRLISNSDTIRRFEVFLIAIPEIALSPPVISDGNDGIAEAGEEFNLGFAVSNFGILPFENIEAAIIVNDAFLTINDDPVHEIGILGSYSKKEFSYKLKSNNACPTGRLISVHLLISDGSSILVEDDYLITIGKPSILLIDADLNFNSAISMEEALKAAKTDCDYLRIPDATLLDYDYIFLFLGHFPSSHTLTPLEDSLLVLFLNQGKSLYLEGGSFFKLNPAMELRKYFSTEGEYFGWLTKPDTLTGIPGTPVEGIQFKCLGDLSKSENLLAKGAAIPWFIDKNSGLSFVTALDSGNYHTIGSSIEFGGTFMFDSPGRSELVQRYLDFLGYDTSPLSATFQVMDNYICKGSITGFTPFSNGNPENYQWAFDGGTPESWEGLSPLIKYLNAGTFSVSLTISNETSSNTFTLENAITVDNCIGIDNSPDTDFKVYPNPAIEYLQISLPVSYARGGEIEIFDLQGRKLLLNSFPENTPEIKLNVSHFSNGIYIIKISSDTLSRSLKLVINQNAIR